ncbi:MAG: hypothetical protein ACYCTB_11270 [bacterium]
MQILRESCNQKDYVEDLCFEYNIDLNTAMLCLNTAIQDYFKNKTVIVNNDVSVDIYDFIRFQNIDIRDADKEKIKKISRKFNYYLNIVKYKSLYEKFKYKTGSLVFGNIISETINGYDVEIDRDYLFDIPESSKAIYPIRYQPVSERDKYTAGEYLAFIINRIKKIEKGNILFILSRTAVILPAKIIESELKINDIKTLLRIPGKYTKLETDLKIPKEVIKKTRDLLKGEVIYYASKKNKKRT